jgi:hypothetical protein
MGTLTADCPRLDAHCAHKLASSCRLTSTQNCCACADERAHSLTYRVYIDGIGFVQRGTRWQGYCWFCKGTYSVLLPTMVFQHADHYQNSGPTDLPPPNLPLRYRRLVSQKLQIRKNSLTDGSSSIKVTGLLDIQTAPSNASQSSENRFTKSALDSYREHWTS